jgi:FkbM family methyltransferase
MFTDPFPNVHKYIFIGDHVFDENKIIVVDTKKRLLKVADNRKITEAMHTRLEALQLPICDQDKQLSMMILRYLRGNEKVLMIGGDSSIFAKTGNTDCVVLESDPSTAQQLRDNPIVSFSVENAALSKRKMVQKNKDTFPSNVLPSEDYSWVHTLTLQELYSKYPLRFDTLVLDCRGAFYHILQEMPEILEHVHTIIVENDYKEYIHKHVVDTLLRQKGFHVDYSCAHWRSRFPCNSNFYQVWIQGKHVPFMYNDYIEDTIDVSLTTIATSTTDNDTERYKGAMIYGINFSIAECKMVTELTLAKKNKMVSSLIPGRLETYIYDTEEDYYHEYQQSFFAITIKKAGWDCLRHYEIVANGCLPFFPNIEECPPYTMTLWPKSLQIEVNEFYHQCVQNDTVDTNQWTFLMDRFLNHARTHLTTRAMANYVITTCGYALEEGTRILFLSNLVSPDYLRCLTLHGFKEQMGARCHDYPFIPHLYTSYDKPSHQLYGKGMTYSKLLDPSSRDDRLDETLKEDIQNHRYDLIVYGSYHNRHEMPLYDLIQTYYDPKEIILMCGGDIHQCTALQWKEKGYTVFVREL